jgi:hypothetical protein
MINLLDNLILEELNSQMKYTNIKKLNSINDLYPLFNWENYKELNPYLYIIGLREDKEYIYNYLAEGRYKGRLYQNVILKKYSFHVLLATIGNDNIFNILELLKDQLSEIDFLTVIFDGKDRSKNVENVINFLKDSKCKVKIIVEDKNLGYWGHGIRNKYTELEGDFIYHVDDDDLLLDNSFDIIRKSCVDKNNIYVFKIMLENNSIIWKDKILKYANISTQSGVIPMHMNKNGYWQLKYGGDYNFYKELFDKYHIIFIDKIIYKKNNKNRNIK